MYPLSEIKNKMAKFMTKCISTTFPLGQSPGNCTILVSPGSRLVSKSCLEQPETKTIFQWHFKSKHLHSQHLKRECVLNFKCRWRLLK